MIINIVKTVTLILLVIGFVSLASGNSAQSMPVAQEFDDEKGLQTTKPPIQGMSPQQSTIGKQDVAGTNVKGDRAQASQASASHQTPPQSGDTGLRATLSSWLPSKQDLDKAFIEVSERSGAPKSTNWRPDSK